MGKGKPGKLVVNFLLFKKRVQELYAHDATSSVDQLVDRLRAKFPEYSRYKLQLSTRMVKQIIDSNQKTTRKYVNFQSKFTHDDHEDDDSTSRMRKKAKKADSREQSDSESATSSESDNGEGEEEEDRSAILTSEDEVYSMQSEQEFDLTKSMLRNKYTRSEIDNVELEVGRNSNNKKKTKTVGLMKEDTRGKEKKANKLSNDDGVVDANMKKGYGPRFKDLGGMDEVINELKQVIIPLYHPEVPGRLRTRPITGVLLHGPPGCGKTTIARAIANETGFPFYEVSATELVSGISGASEEKIRELFSKASRTSPSIIFIDEIDAIASKRGNHQRGMENRIVTQLMKSMDQPQKDAKPDDTSKDLETSDNKPRYVLVIGATNSPDALEPALRRPGRFDREFALGVPDENARFQMLKVVTRDVALEGNIDLVKIARVTPGFVGADLAQLVNEAGMVATKRVMDERDLKLCEGSGGNEDSWKNLWTDEELDKLRITMLDLEKAVKRVQASSTREGFSGIPNVTWEDVGGLDSLRKEFDSCMVDRIKYPHAYEEYEDGLETGVLLYGPPGCGKTLIAKAVANDAGTNFIHIKGPELLSKYVGESESEVRKIFRCARMCSPCIVFFDEIDSIATQRGKEGGWVVERLVGQLLSELNGADQRKGVYVIGATNRPEMVDKALLRPGRFGKLLYVPLPNPDERGLILKALARKKPLDAYVDLVAIGRSKACANFSGADLSALITGAVNAATEERVKRIKAGKEAERCSNCLPNPLKSIHFKKELGKISPSVSKKQKQHYDRLSKRFTTS